MPLFVWVKGLRGPEPQIWQQEQTDGSGKDKNNLIILSKRLISENQAKASLQILAQDYPYEPKASA